MTRSLALSTLALLGSLAVPAVADEDVRNETGSYPIEDARLVSVDIPVGELRVVGTSGGTVEARLRVSCDRDTRRCREEAARIHLRPRRTGTTMELAVVGMKDGNRRGSSPTPHVELSIPSTLALRAELGVGEVDVRGLVGDIDVETGVGEVRVEIAESAVREVTLDVGVGEARLSPRPDDVQTSRFLFLGNEVDWRDGTGTAHVTVEVGVGEATVRLEP